MKRRLAVSELIFKIISYLLLTVFALCCLYPFVYAISSSISSRYAVDHGDISLLPGESSPGYQLQDGSVLWMEELKARKVKQPGDDKTETAMVWVAQWQDGGAVEVYSSPLKAGQWEVTLPDGTDYAFEGSTLTPVPTDGTWFVRLADGKRIQISQKPADTSWYCVDDNGERTPADKPFNPDEYPAWGVVTETTYKMEDGTLHHVGWLETIDQWSSWSVEGGKGEWIPIQWYAEDANGNQLPLFAAAGKKDTFDFSAGSAKLMAKSAGGDAWYVMDEAGEPAVLSLEITDSEGAQADLASPDAKAGADETFTLDGITYTPRLNLSKDAAWYLTPAYTVRKPFLPGSERYKKSAESFTLALKWYHEDESGNRVLLANPPEGAFRMTGADEAAAHVEVVDEKIAWMDREDVARKLSAYYHSRVLHLVSEDKDRVWKVSNWPGKSGDITLDGFNQKVGKGRLLADGTVAWGEASAAEEGAVPFEVVRVTSRFNVTKNVQFDAFLTMFNDDMFWNSYSNTLFLTIYGTIWSLFVAILGGYALSKKRLLFRKFFNFFLVFTMWFSAGIVPQLINYRNTKAVFSLMGIVDDKWLIVIAMGMAAMNIILLRNAFENVPSEIEEASIVDGATEFQVMTKVFIPMSKSTIATVALFFAISRWNGYFWARQMITNEFEKPLQVFINDKLNFFFDGENTAGWAESYSWQSVIYALIVCSIVPILIIYPFIQKYFAKGTNAGGVKE